MRISVVIPAFNEERLIAATLTAITAATSAFARRGWATELIVCDNNSTDRTAELARSAGATVVFEPVNQIGRARNRGAAAATGDWLVFVDADSKPAPGLFEEVAAAIEAGKCLAGGCIVVLDGHYPAASRMIGIWNCISRSLKYMAGSFIFCETAAFRRLGGFSPDLYAAEEIDLSKRLKQLARQMRRTIVILHQHPLVTSARKIHLYKFREHLWFVARATLFPGRTLTNREACHPWYDGRR